MTARVLTPERLEQLATSHARAAAVIAERAALIARACERAPARHGGLELLTVAGGQVYLEAHPEQLCGPWGVERPWPWGGAR